MAGCGNLKSAIDINNSIYSYCGLLPTVHGACSYMDGVTCATNQLNDLRDAGNDHSKLCSASRSYISCLKTAGCDKDANYKSIIDDLKKYINISCGLLATVHGACSTADAEICRSKLVKDKHAAKDFPKMCSADRNYISCMKIAVCENDAHFKPIVDKAKKSINVLCGGSMVTVSIATMFLALFAVFFK